jgi:Zn-dependent protease
MSPTLSRISFTIHVSGWLPVAALIALGIRDLGVSNGMLSGALVVASMLLHELAHTCAALLFRVPVHGIGIKLVGAYTHRKYASLPMHDVLIAAAGPAANLILTVAFLFVPKAGAWLAEWNFGIVVLNLLPFPGSDGYRIVKTLFWPDAAIYPAKLRGAA